MQLKMLWSVIFFMFLKEIFLLKKAIYCSFYLNIFQNVIYSCDVKAVSHGPPEIIIIC